MRGYPFFVLSLRFPWILSRRRLCVAAVLDCFLFITLYSFLFKARFYRWPDISLSLGVFIAIWLIISYVIGRYSGGEDVRSMSQLRFLLLQIIRSVIALACSLAIVLIYTLSVESYERFSLLRSYYIIFIAPFGVSSALLQCVVYGVLRHTFPSSQHWNVLGSFQELQKLQEFLRWTRFKVSLSHLKKGEIALSKNPIVVTDLTSLSDETIRELLVVQQSGRPVMNRISWCECILQRFPDLLSESDLLHSEFSVPMGTVEIRIKRIGDVLFSTILLISLFPILLLSAILIKMYDRGPIFYSQIRTGKGGIPFRIWKLRSMCIDAEKKGIQWSSIGDTRITPIGLFLRNTRIDELPQLWSVLIGNMSLIGPRPERPEIESRLKFQIPHYNFRYSIRPGLSGWAQVNYPYGSSVEDAANKLSYDLYYLKNLSLWLDFLILFKTMRLIFQAQGSNPL